MTCPNCRRAMFRDEHTRCAICVNEAMRRFAFLFVIEASYEAMARYMTWHYQQGRTFV